MVVRIIGGYVIEDRSDLSLEDFHDAIKCEKRTADETCDSEFDRYACTRHRNHDGPAKSGIFFTIVKRCFDALRTISRIS